MPSPIRVLIVESSREDAESLTGLLTDAGYDVSFAVTDSAEDLRSALEGRHWDILVYGDCLPHVDMLRVIEILRESGADIPFIVVSSSEDVRAAAAAMKAGAGDYFAKSGLSGFAESVAEEIRNPGRRGSGSAQPGAADAPAGLKYYEEALRESEERFHGVLENSLDALYRRNYRTNRYEYMSPAITGITGYTPEEMIVRTVEETVMMLHPDDIGRITAELQQLFSSGGGRISMQYRFYHKNGSLRWAGDIATVFMDSDGNPDYGIGSVRDITDFKKAEEKFEASLHEKDALLRELYHRTRNNMQVICSLLMMQLYDTDDERVRWILKDVECRIRSMSLVHEKLYQSGNLSSIDLGEYVKELAHLLAESHSIESDRIAIDISAENVVTLLDTAVPCGLLLNELITNSFKHAFPEGRRGRIALKLHREGDGVVELTVSDDGVGVPEEFDFDRHGRIGLKIIRAIGEEQLQGSISFASNNGVRCTVRFRDSRYSPRV